MRPRSREGGAKVREGRRRNWLIPDSCFLSLPSSSRSFAPPSRLRGHIRRIPGRRLKRITRMPAPAAGGTIPPDAPPPAYVRGPPRPPVRRGRRVPAVVGRLRGGGVAPVARAAG